MEIRQDCSFPRAVATTRRSSLAAPVALAIATLLSRSSPNEAAAKKKRKKKCPPNPCTSQAEPCREVITRKCDGQVSGAEECKADFLPCCDFLADCNAAAAMECLLKDA
jgi:hypothetical protein